MFDLELTKACQMLKTEVENLAKTANPASRPRELLERIQATVGLGEILMRENEPPGQAAFEIHITGRADWFAAALPFQPVPYFREGDLLVKRCSDRPAEINMTLSQVKSELGDLIDNFNGRMQRQVLGMEDHLSSLLRERARAERKPDTLEDVLARHGVKKVSR